MRLILFSILFLLLPKLTFSQISPNDKAILLDSLFTETSNQDYVYIRIIKDYKTRKKSYEIYDYYKSGKTFMKGASTTNDHLTKEGQCAFFYENGNKKSVLNFVKNRPTGKEYKWYENGNYKLEGEYIADNTDKKENNKYKYKINQFWNADGVQKVTDGNGTYEESDEKFFGTGSIKDGFKDGIWSGWIINPKIKYTENYKDGQFISGKTVDENNIETVYTILEKKPEPKKGIMDFYKYIGKNYTIPYNAKSLSLSGKIYVRFTVGKDGKIIQPRIIKDIGYGTGDEALRVLTNCENWNPGEQKGQKVNSLYTLPITIQSTH
jgi:antitoxin component YwqK of YwqJK toxin-antitoxin module